MTGEEAWNRIDAIIEKHEVDDVYVTINNHKDYDALRFARKLLEQEHCEDEYIKVPKKALKYRTAGMVAYNAEWLKNHFDIERAVICGAQQSCGDAISRQAAIEKIHWLGLDHDTAIMCDLAIRALPSVNPQEPRWIPVSERLPEDSGEYLVSIADASAYVDATYYDVKEGTWRELEWNEEVIAWMPLPEPYKAESEGSDANSN